MNFGFVLLAALGPLLHDIESFGPRAIGQPGHVQTGDWLAERVTATGLRVVGWQTVLVDMPVDVGSKITWATGSAKVYALWPNSVVPPVLPAGGLTGRVVYAGKGRLTEFDGQDVRGAIVLMEYASERRWMNAASLGAGAVVLLPDPNPTAAENMAKWTSIPLQCPRFYLDDPAAAAQLRAAGKATLTGGMRWQRLEARNLVAVLPATEPVKDGETILINVPYDAGAVAPAAAVGGQTAGNLAAALTVLETLSHEKRSRDLLVLFDGAHSMNGAGTRAFASVLRDLNVSRAQSPRMQTQLQGVKPWMDARRQILATRAGRLQAAIEWLSKAGKFDYRDPVAVERSAWLPQADAWQWLQEEMRDQVKGAQIAAILAKADEPQREYYRRVTAETTPEGMLEAMRAKPVAGVEVTPASLADGYRAELRDVEQQRRVLEQDFALREALRPFVVERHITIDLSAGSSVLTLTREFRIGRPQSAFNAQNEWMWNNGPQASQAAERIVERANRERGGGAVDFVDSVTFNAARVRQAGPSPAFDVGVDAAMAGVSPYRLCTANDPRMRLLGPGDRMPRGETEIRNLQIQAQTVALLLQELLRDPGIFPAAEQIRARTVEVGGKVVVSDPRAGPFPRLPVAKATVVLPNVNEVSGDVFLTRYALTDRHGEFRFDAVQGGAVPEAEGTLELAAFQVSDETGMLAYAPDAARTQATSTDLARDEVYLRLVCFKGSALQLYGLADPMLLAPPTSVTLLAGKGGSLESWYLSAPAAEAVVGVVPPDSRVKVLTSISGYGHRMFLLGDQSVDFSGTGFEVGAGTNFVGTTMAAARDLSRLNATRLEKLESKGVRSRIAARLHRDAGKSLAASEVAVASNVWSAAEYLARDAWGRELRAYPRILEMANQAVLAAVILLAFVAVWAVFMERICVQAGSVYGRIGGALAFFGGALVVLYFLHPAFQISQTPVIILVAYALEVLAMLALAVVAGKYAETMKEWRERTGGIHASDISRAGALAVAFSLGLTNLAKRPLRTALMIVTVSLLAFSVMTFTSVETTLDTRFVPVTSNEAPASDSVLLRLYKWAAIPTTMADSFESDLGPGSSAVRRTLKLNARRPWEIGLGVNRFVFTHGDASFTAEGLQGFMPAEGAFSRLPECVNGRWFSGEKDEVILPAAVAKALGVSIGDVVQYGNSDLSVIGILDTARADALRDCSGEPLALVDFYASGLILSPTDTDLRNASGTETGVKFMSFDRVVLLPHRFIMDLGGEVYSVAGKLPQMSRSAIENLMSRIEVNLFAAVAGKSYLVQTARSQSVQGAWKLIMPILLVVLIMVNAMLGTVEERNEEILMLGAVGLAPRHVTILFLAEACVYGVLGVVFGVMLGLGVGWLTSGWASGVDVNYASVSTMMMGMFVLVVVVLATWIPAAHAARLATPSGAAKWELPASADGRLALKLPFNVTRENGLGVFAFLHEYLNGHRESTSPDFRCTELKAGVVSSAVEIAGQVWPAPYDRQVSQLATLRLSPVDGTHLFRVEVACERLSGELEAWNRGVFEFLDLVRRQFLIYRTLPDDHKRRYVESAFNLLKSGN